MREIARDLRKPQYTRKAEQVTELEEKIGRARAAILIEYRGMTVKDTTELRSRLRKTGAEMVVAKNTLVRRAAADTSIQGLDSYLEGPNGLVFGYEDGVATVKALSDFTRDNRFLLLKAGFVEGRVFEEEDLKSIARMPPREQIIGQLLGALQAPAANLVGMLQAPMAQLVFTLQAIGERG